ncbi:MAG: energy transducer TonB [Pseudomonadales bacterium]
MITETGAEERLHSRDRLFFALFLALLIHAALFLGVQFEAHKPSISRPALPVPLTLKPSATPPDTARYLSNADTQGEDQDAAALAFTESLEDPFTDLSSEPPARLSNPESDSIALQARRSEPLNFKPDLSDFVQPGWRPLNAIGDRDRVKRITQVNAKTSPEAFYLESWRRKVEAIGNLNYPAEAKAQEIYGRLRLLVAILPDGRLKEARILSSSGYPILDQAALNIIDLAAPFAPFPTALRREVDVLEIVRTWEFRRQGGGLRFGS